MLETNKIFEIIWYILISISIAELSIQIVISELSDKVKRITGLNYPYKYTGLSEFKFWSKFLDRWYITLFPIVLLVVVLFKLHKFISELVSCCWCTATWFALAVNYYYFNFDIIKSILLVGLTLVFVTLIEKKHN